MFSQPFAKVLLEYLGIYHESLVDILVFIVLDAEEIDAVVVGLPVNMDGTESKRSQKVRDFASALQQKIHQAVLLHDERLSSYEAESLVVELDLTRKKKKKRLDAIAAAAILRSFLEAKS